LAFSPAATRAAAEFLSLAIDRLAVMRSPGESRRDVILSGEG
jgi:hypothetical protein